MGQDLCIDCGGGVVNIRVGAIILKDGKFLMVSNPAVDYLDYYNNRRIKLKLKGLTPAQHRYQALQVA